MEMLSDEYGWTPSQIKNEDSNVLSAYIEIINAKRLINKNNGNK